MPTHRISLDLDSDKASAVQACRQALAEMQLLIKRDDGTSFVANEKANLLGFSWPAKVEIQISQSGTVSQVNIKTSNGGMGPIQSAHVKGITETLTSKMRLHLSKRESNSSSLSLATELQRLASLREQGLLTDDEYAAAKAKIL